MNRFKKQLRNWNQNVEEKYYCCLQYGYLFHDYVELRDFDNNIDDFSSDDD
ncbi:MAG: hypothetical protein ACTSRI_08485 [Promethearchaeota archaeon]